MTILLTNPLEQEEFQWTRIFFGWLQPECRARIILHTQIKTVIKRRNLCSELKLARQQVKRCQKEMQKCFFTLLKLKQVNKKINITMYISTKSKVLHVLM